MDDMAPEFASGSSEQLITTIDSDEVQIEDIDAAEEVISATYEINSYGADYDVEGLVRRMNKDDIVVPSFDPDRGTEEVVGFQRGYVWLPTQRSRFIESLLLGLPVPGIFLIRDRENRLLVLDGQQRLKTLQAFYAGTIGEKKFRLNNVQAPFQGLTYDELEPEDRRRLDDSIIHATVLRQESPSGSQNAVYSIYERLSTGGSPLQPQEIRIALFPGVFLKGISALSVDSHWRNLFGPPSPRYRDHELILRVLAMYEQQDQYFRPLKGFLNDYLQANQDRDLDPATGIGALFIAAMRLLDETIGKQAFRPERAVNAAYLDSISVGLMRRIASGQALDGPALLAAYSALVERDDFREATLFNTSSEEAVNTRISAAAAAFAHA